MSKRKQSRPQPPPRQCLFCECIANSPEHMWPDWAGQYFEKTAHDKSLETTERVGWHEQPVPPPRIIHGHPTTVKVKHVCRGCNNGWMSILETAAKPFLEPMLLGRRVTLDADAQRTMARWITLKMMVWEHTDERGVVFSRAQTLAFSASRTIPDNSKIWLFRSQGRWLRQRIGHAYAGIFEKGFKVPDVLKEKANTKTVLFGIGQLLIFFEYSVHPQLALGEFRQLDATAIWPPLRLSVSWPPMRTVNDAQATYIIGTLDRYLKRPGMISLF